MGPRAKRVLSDDEEEEYIERGFSSSDEEYVGPSRKEAKKGGKQVRAPPKKKARVSGSGLGLGESDPTIQTSMGEVTDRVRDLLDDDKALLALEDDLSGEAVTTASKVPWVPKDWVDTLGKMVDHHPLGKKVIAFAEGVKAGDHPMASEDVMAFLEKETPGWASHCTKVDAIWDEGVKELAEITGREIKEFVKPSGPLGAAVAVVWHYPTTRSQKQEWGMVFDHTNPCLRMQDVKIGTSGSILTVDNFPLRVEYDKEEHPFQKYAWWPKFKVLCLKLSHDFAALSKFRLVLGEENWGCVVEEARTSTSYIYTAINLSFENGLKVYRKKPVLYVVEDKKSGEISQVILQSMHLQSLFYQSRSTGLTRYSEAMWNIAAAVGGVRDVNVDYFDWKKDMTKTTKDVTWDKVVGSPVGIAIKMVGWERENKTVIDAAIVRARLNVPTSVQPGPDGSLAVALLVKWNEKSVATNAARGFPELHAENRAKAHATMRAGGWEALKRGKATQLTRADKNDLAKLAALQASGRLEAWAKIETGRPSKANRVRNRITLKDASAKFTALIEQGDQVDSAELRKLLVRFRGNFYPREDGLRWEGDGGPELDIPATNDEDEVDESSSIV